MTIIRTALLAASMLTCGPVAMPAMAAQEAAALHDDAYDAAWEKMVDGYIHSTFVANPPFGVTSGKHEFDGKLPNFTKAGIDAEIARLESAIATAQAFDPARLDEDHRFERDYLIAWTRGQLFWLKDAEQPYRNPAYYVGAISPSPYVSVPYAPPATRLDSYIKYLGELPAAAAQIKANLRTPMPRPYVDFAVNAFGGFSEYFLGDGVAAFAGVGTADQQAKLTARSKAASVAFAVLRDWAEAQRDEAGEDFALGAELFSKMLRDTEMVDVSLDQLMAIGQADLQANLALLEEACARYAPGMSPGDCVAKMNAEKPKGGAVEGARAQLDGLKRFLIEEDIVSIPGTEEAKVDEAPPYRRQNFAYIEIPGPYEEGLPSVYYIAPPDPSWPQEVQDDFVPGEKELLYVSVHEVWPGHFLNFLHANRAESFFGRLFVGYAYAEGWAHYTEEMMRVAGLDGGSDETLIGQLSNALRRDCRYISAIGLHSGTMTQEQSYELFRDQCFQDEGNSRQQAARGTYDPGYLNYTMGKLMIRKLREDWTASRGGREAWKEFHDEFLSYGGPPIPLVRREMMGEAEAESAF